MRYTLRYSTKFKKQYRKLHRSGKTHILTSLNSVIEMLAEGKNLPVKHRNHELTGKLADFLECHVLFDWLLIYRIHKEQGAVELVATGTHSELFK